LSGAVVALKATDGMRQRGVAAEQRAQELAAELAAANKLPRPEPPEWGRRARVKLACPSVGGWE